MRCYYILLQTLGKWNEVRKSRVMIHDIQLTEVYRPTNALATRFTIPDIVQKYSREI
jgi:hypothetical protein